VVIGAYQDRLVAQKRAPFARFKNAITHFLDLSVLVVAVDELGPRAVRTMGLEASPKALGRVVGDCVCGVADRLG
jgi:hypothetical protein